MDCKWRRKRTNSSEIFLFSADASWATNDAGQTTTADPIQNFVCRKLVIEGKDSQDETDGQGSSSNNRKLVLLNYL